MNRHERALRALVNVLPPSVDVDRAGGAVAVGGQPLSIEWIGEGWLADARQVLNGDVERPLVVAARRMSPGAQKALGEASIGWVDETGAAEIAIGPIIVAKSGVPVDRDQRLTDWIPSVLAVAEALLCGTKATVAATEEATGLSSGSCTNALRFLQERALLISQSSRGRYSARRIADFDRLLDSYASAVADEDPLPFIEVGVLWRDLISGLAKTGKEWELHGREWACTGSVAASVLAPFTTTVGSADVYIDVDTLAGLQAAAAEVDLETIEGGRLRLRPFPTATSKRLRGEREGLSLAPWPRVYADLRPTGVRGEEAAEHLRGVMRGR